MLKANSSAVRGLVINRFTADGVRIQADFCAVLGCFIGITAAGDAAAANGAGVTLTAGSAVNTIGSATAGLGNLISGNLGPGVFIAGVGAAVNRVLGNRIGTNAAGTAALANGSDGVYIGLGAASNVVGGTVAGAGNIISGNGVNGVHLEGFGTVANVLQGNRVGLDLNGASLGNGYSGVVIDGGAARNTVGGITAAARNVISGNTTNAGVDIAGPGTTGNLIQGNFIGTGVDGLARRSNAVGVQIEGGATANTIGGLVIGARNVISGNNFNQNLGIHITGAGSDRNLVLGNFLGVDVTGLASLNNGNNVVIDAGASHNQIGGTTATARNVIANGVNGVLISGATTTDNRVQGNFIGTDATGSAVQPNNTGISVSAPNNLIGGTVAGARNIIAGASLGVFLNGANATGNLVQGNFIGTDAAGTAALGNTDGVVVTTGANHNTVGGTTVAARNVIAGSFRFGVRITGIGTTANVFQGNLIGVAANGTSPLGNASHGVIVTDLAAGNTIGGSVPGAGNVIANSGRDGVLIGSDPTHPGTTFPNPAGTGNVVLSNRIFANAGQAIDLGPNDGPTANDSGDGDTGPNGLQNTPVLTLALSLPGVTVIKGTLDSVGPQTYRIELYADAPGGTGQARTYLGALTLFQSSFGPLKFSTALPFALPVGTQISATATGPEGTSELSPFFLVT